MNSNLNIVANKNTPKANYIFRCSLIFNLRSAKEPEYHLASVIHREDIQSGLLLASVKLGQFRSAFFSTFMKPSKADARTRRISRSCSSSSSHSFLLPLHFHPVLKPEHQRPIAPHCDRLDSLLPEPVVKLGWNGIHLFERADKGVKGIRSR